MASEKNSNMRLILALFAPAFADAVAPQSNKIEAAARTRVSEAAPAQRVSSTTGLYHRGTIFIS